MIEVTVRDGRVERDQTQESDEGGAILATFQREQPYEINDVITLAEGEAVVVIGTKENILPDRWRQTVFISDLNRRQLRLKISLGHCPEWTLQSATPTTTNFVRCVSDAEAEQIKAAAGFCRKYGTMPTHRLLSSSFIVWQETFQRVTSMKGGEWNPGISEELLGAFVGWLLIWRLILDQAEHDLSSRCGNTSRQLASFRLARKNAYDSSSAYRVIEALRNLVQHREMPSLTLNRNEALDHTTGQRRKKISYSLPVADLLRSPKCPATIKKQFADTPDLELDLPTVVDQAMAAIKPVLLELITISVPELNTNISYLRTIFSQASGMPLLLRAKQPTAASRPGGVNLEMVQLHDLQFLIQNFPMPGADPTKNASM